MGDRHRRRHRHHPRAHHAVTGHLRRARQVPTVWEMAVGAVQDQVNDSIGPRGAKVVPLALTLFVFIFTCNLFEVVGIGSKLDALPAPISDINLPLAMALYVIVMVHRAAIKNRGIRGYFAHYFSQPFPK